MKINKGDKRITLIFKNFVIKLPIIRLRIATKEILRNFRRGTLRKCLSWTTDMYGSPKRMLFKGIKDNWNEFYFYQRCRSPFLIPTYFSLFGLMNIQKRGAKLEMDKVDFFGQLYKITNEEVTVNRHTFSNPDNFCELNNKLLIVDYGELNTHDVLAKYGDKIHNEFDFNYVRSKKYKDLP